MIVATAGHVDHGKTSLIKALTGVETDRLPEEKARGVSIELGFAYMPVDDGNTIGFIDVPGHEKFIRNMLAGVAGIDAALLVVAADDGVMPQTLEHLAILDLLGVSAGVIALTKCDLVDEARATAAEAEIREVLAGTSLEKLRIIRTATLAGMGIEDLKGHILELQNRVPQKVGQGGFRLAIDRNFSLPGVGRIVTGTVFSGEIAVGDRIVLSDLDIECRVRGIHVQDTEAERAKAGDRAALNIVSVTGRMGEIRRGCWAVTPQLNVASDRFDVTLKVLASEPRPLRNWAPVHVHLAAKHVLGRVAILEGRGIEPGQTGKVQIVTSEPMLGNFGDNIILRNQSASRTIGGGRIVDPFSPARGRSRADRLLLVEKMTEPDPAIALEGMLEVSQLAIDLERFAIARNLADPEATQIFDQANMARIHKSGQNIGLSVARYNALKDTTISILEAWHLRDPHQLGPDQRGLLRAYPSRVSGPFYELAVTELIDEGKIKRTAGHLHLADHRPVPTAADQKVWQGVSRLLQEDDGKPSLQPPVPHALAEELSITPEEVLSFLNRATELAWVIGVARNRYLLPEAVNKLAASVVELAERSESGQFSVRDFRDETGIGRNLVIQLLEFFDRHGLTKRIGDVREVTGKARDIF